MKTLDKAAFQLLPDSVEDYVATVAALKKRFQPVDIEDLCGLEFHMLTQDTQSVEQVGMELQGLAKRTFPGLIGKDLDCFVVDFIKPCCLNEKEA